MKKLPLLLLSFLPLGCQMPYIFSAWNYSRLDQWDWIFYLLIFPAAWWCCRKEKTGKWDLSALFLLIPMLFLTVTTGFHQINMLGVVSAVMTVFAAVWLIYSWHFACRLLPAVMIMLLGTPSSTYIVSVLLMLPVTGAYITKLLLALAGFVWIWSNRKFDFRIKRSTVLFLTAVSGSSLLLFHAGEICFEGIRFTPEFSGHAGEYFGRTIQPDDNTKRFFVTSSIRQFRYTRNDVDISVLAVQCGSDIHEIHPASHCLRTSNWTICSESILYVQDDFAVTEIDARKGKNRFLVWVWYSSDEFSTPGFLGFRRHFRPGGNYYTYQLAIPVYDTAEASRSELKNFIRSLKQELPE